MRLALRAAIAVVVAAVLLGLYNDFAIRHRVNHSLAEALPAQSGLHVLGCRRFTDLLLEGKNFFLCRVGHGGRTQARYLVNIQGRCWRAWPESSTLDRIPARLRGCLPVLPT